MLSDQLLLLTTPNYILELQSIKQRFGIIGNTLGLNNALQRAMDVAPTDLSVLILGGSGVGKEVFSKIIHDLSPRKHNGFIAVNCGAIPEGTIDSELFGHEKGAFTGATDKRKGYFEGVDGGTIFLDEIGEMPLGTQARLLRVLESGEFIKVGSSKVIRTDVRVVAATNVDLLTAVRNGKFREDLYYRLSTVPIRIPPLSERLEDIPLLFRKFSIDIADRYRIQPLRLDAEAKDLLLRYPWPGNIRELKNVAEQMTVLSEDRNVTAAQLVSYLPKVNVDNRLPALLRQEADADASFSDRDILYKILFDMRKDITDLKQAILRLGGRSADMPDTIFANDTAQPVWSETEVPAPSSSTTNYTSYPQIGANAQQPILLRTSGDGKFKQDAYNEHIEVEESLSIADKEKELIQKALKKHRGKRKDAARDLGISERTLYRKIKEYEIRE